MYINSIVKSDGKARSLKKDLRRAVLNGSGMQRVANRHPWIFRSNLIQIPVCEPGDLIAVADREGNVVARGLWSESELCIRILTFGSHEPDQMALLRKRAEEALALRKRWCGDGEAFRWVHGEADGLPGISADLYGDVLSLQLSVFGWYRHAEEVAKIFRKIRKLSAVILRNDTKYLRKEGIPQEVKPLLGSMPGKPLCVRIGDHLELIDVAEGQKTGTYLDVRNVPALLDPVYKGARVLDCFAYQGHFTIHALAHGAAEVTVIDQSQTALDRAKENILLNDLPADRAVMRCGNAFDIMRELDGNRERYDVVIMDPPPFSPSRAQLDSARRGYKELAVRGLRRLSSGGHMIFMSCSHAFSAQMLMETLAEAAKDADKVCRVVREIHQPYDHPALLSVPETDYLKGFVLGVE
ncbi:MAG: class I SAM-dependent rRNA methyltransferase [Synergistes sp.]|nr:class I SAM-dependent rRNA methyltransferase [Synergistes sp.]